MNVTKMGLKGAVPTSSEASSETPILSSHPDIFKCCHRSLSLQGMVGQVGSKGYLGIYVE